ncbi:DNA alkylation repair protein [Aquabacterium soli]|uniref:DNA alkylation repair protein n=1 Tax=Aquabacterium soli TaxID=2493092 RepID=A0A426V6J4_9BURK|nr:DNA alkylation repair protein [Aquabacterium soli]RRS02549.1 DNA alkylation repair protein [Aquabacterium soli]
MAEAFKNLINAEVVRQAGQHLRRVWPAFDQRRFERLALDGLDDLEFKARAQHLGLALLATMPDDFHHAADVLEASFKPVIHVEDPDKELGLLRTDDTGLAGWVLWPVGEFIAQRGLEHPERALQALHALTQRFTAEFAIRPIIVAHPELSLRTLAGWTTDPSAHVRRLVSEGSRPRLPWGLRLKALVLDPTPTLPLLEALQDDASEYVRRSVANHLNDIAKDHPERLADWLECHLPDAPLTRQRLLRHASRTLIKQGHGRTLSLWGLGAALDGSVRWQVSPKRVAIGESVALSLTLASTSASPQILEIDYTVHHARAQGGASAKTFKGWRVSLAPGETLQLAKSHSMRPVTTRRYHPGEHQIDLRINGQTVAQAGFKLTA